MVTHRFKREYYLSLLLFKTISQKTCCHHLRNEEEMNYYYELCSVFPRRFACADLGSNTRTPVCGLGHVDWQVEGCFLLQLPWNDDVIEGGQLTSEISPPNNRYCLCLGFHPPSIQSVKPTLKKGLWWSKISGRLMDRDLTPIWARDVYIAKEYGFIKEKGSSIKPNF